jgi:predicted nucleotidyltransferase
MNKSILEKLFSVLGTFDIPYVLIGGYAVAAWGSVRATKDVDFLAAIPYNMVNQVLDQLKSHGFTVEYRAADIGDPVMGVIKLEFQVGNELESVELLLGIKKMPDKIYLRAEKINILGLEIPVISPEDLIVLKLLAGSPLDILDAKNIYRIVEERMDMAYLEKELKRCRLSLKAIE